MEPRGRDDVEASVVEEVCGRRRRRLWHLREDLILFHALDPELDRRLAGRIELLLKRLDVETYFREGPCGLEEDVPQEVKVSEQLAGTEDHEDRR